MGMTIGTAMMRMTRTGPNPRCRCVMPDEKAVPNQVTYQGELVGDSIVLTEEYQGGCSISIGLGGQINLTSVQYPSEFVGEDGQVVMTCEPVEVVFQNVMDCCEDPLQFIPRDQTVMHQTIGGKGVVGRIK